MNQLTDPLALIERDDFSKSALEALPLAVCVIDNDGMVLFANSRCHELAAPNALYRPELVGRNYFTTLEKLGAGAAARNFVFDLHEIQKRQRDEALCELECLCAGRPRWFEVRATRLPNDAFRRVLISHTDITARRVPEREVNFQAALDQHTVALQQQIADLRSFGHSVAHDLRNPMAVVAGFAHELTHSHTPELSPGARENLMYITRGVNQLSGMLDGLLTLSQVVRDAPILDQVNLAILARDVAGGLAHRDPHRAVSIAVRDMPPARCDVRLLQIAMQNLLENAWKFTAHKTDAKIEVGSTIDAHGKVIYFVRDNGIGFPADAAEKVFQPFKRPASAHGFASAGIGLATVKRIVDCHNGRIWAESKSDNGATFFFTLA